MNKIYQKRLPQWYKDNTAYDLVLSDDIDSLLTTAILKAVKPQWDIQYFYDFDTLYVSKDIADKKYKMQDMVWCDVAVLWPCKAIDNHVSRFAPADKVNGSCINPNLINHVTKENYMDKFAGSTALTTWSLYDLPLPKAEEGKMLLLAIDSGYLGYYSNCTKFKEMNKFYLCDMLDLPELYEVEQRHTAEDFERIVNKYNLLSKIGYNRQKNDFSTGLDISKISDIMDIRIEIPHKKQFTPFVTFANNRRNLYELKSLSEITKRINRIATLAITDNSRAKRRSTVKFSTWSDVSLELVA